MLKEQNLMDLLTIIGLIGAVIGIAVGLFQLIEYILKLRKRKKEQDKIDLIEFPNNLPSRDVFIGREIEKSRIQEALKSRSYLISIVGIGGIGKTALALEVAYECFRATMLKQNNDNIVKFDGFIWTSAKDHDLILNTFLDTILRTLDHVGLIKKPLDEKLYEVNKLIRQKSFLIIVDNFETITDEGIINFLIKLPEPSKAIITTREQRLKSTWIISLKGLDKSEAIQLFYKEAERLDLLSILNKEEKEIIQLYELTGGAPLAIKWTIGQMKQKGQTFSTLLTYLKEAKGNIFDSIFANSWSLLSIHAQKLIMMMSIFRDSLSRSTIEGISDIHDFTLEEALEQLLEMSLINVNSGFDQMKCRYTIHPLTRIFVGSKLKDCSEFETFIRERSLEFYTKEITKYIKKGWSGFNELEIEKINILDLINWSYEYKWEKGKEISLLIKWFLWEHGLWYEKVELYKKGLIIAESINDFNYIVKFAFEIGWVYCRQGDLKQAQFWLEKARKNFKEAHISKLDLANLNSLKAMILKSDGKIVESKKLLEEVLNIFIENDQTVLESLRVMTYLGELAKDEGDLILAKQWFSKTLEYAKKKGETSAYAWSLGNLGEVMILIGELDEARDLLNAGLQRAIEMSRHHTIAQCTYWLGVLEEKIGHYKKAYQFYTKARESYQRIGILTMEIEAKKGESRTYLQPNMS